MTVNYDKRSYTINGQQVFLNSAAIHYFRMPREEWREVLVKAKLAGMNCIDTYFAWNVHEPEEGEWSFEGDKDCGAFLDLCAELGLWVIARPGPFICAEWDFGGFPWWLNNKQEVAFRTHSKPYLDYVDRYFDKIIPIIRDRQITQGGSVILVQVENEYGYLEADEAAASYMKYLRDGLLQRGIEVPLITCVGGVEGAIEGANFWSNADQHYEELERKQPDMPKIVTEFWTGWFEHWGAQAATQKTAGLYEKRTLEVLRAGYSGISHYMFYGGTNFGGYGGRTVGASDIFMVTSYDYDAPLNEYERVTEKYAVAKKLSYYIQAISGFLLNAEEEQSVPVRLSEGFTARSRGRGRERIWFVESGKQERENAYLTLSRGNTVPVTVKPGAITPVLEQLEISQEVFLTCNSYLLANEAIAGVHTLIIAADNGNRSWIEIEAGQPIELTGQPPQLMKLSGDRKQLTLDSFHFSEPQVLSLSIGGKLFQLILVNGDMADSAWRFAGPSGTRWALGYPDMDVTREGQIMAAVSRREHGVLLLGNWENATAPLDESPYVHLEKPELSLVATSSVALAPSEDHVYSGVPLDFSSMEVPYGYLLYTCDFEQGPGEVRTVVIPKVQDTFRVYVNGEASQLVRQVGASSLELKLKPNETNRLQLLVQNMGRLNFSPFLGEFKGIQGPVFLDGNSVDMRDQWQHGAQSLHLGQVCSVEPGTVLQRTFTIQGQDRAILVGAMSGELTINGQAIDITGYKDWFMFHTLDISAYIREGLNTIEMKYIKSPIDRLELISYHSQNELNGWSIQDANLLEHSAVQDQQSGNGPVRHSFHFNRPECPEAVHARLKLRLTGMSKGYVKLNGTDIGRYWGIGPQEDYKLPMAWLKETNVLEIFDEEGRSAAGVKLIFDEHSSMRWVTLG
ncbi:beta-galactosidase [Paenibacillus sp. HW567]|uniref:beta-galactosidase n=1 Tax=Paenibacillus sp. HW567 TaxID=1034769 RepID=UPI0003747B2D